MSRWKTWSRKLVGTSWLVLLLPGGALLTVAALLAAAPASESELAARGKVTYRVYCSNCHGAAAKGDGKLAALLTIHPADLTALAAANGGVFASETVRAAIDGRQAVAAHGPRDMPIWGLAFQQPDLAAPQEQEVQAKIDQLVAFLRSIQEPRPAAK